MDATAAAIGRAIRVPIINHDELVCIVDAADAELVAPHKWYWKPSGRTGYAQTYGIPLGQSRTVGMHRLLLGFPDATVDHINGNGLDNRRSNLRVATAQQNTWNTPTHGKHSRFKGVSPSWSKWKAEAKKDGRSIYLGSFETQEEAARAYDAWVLENRGEFAWLNFPNGVERV